MKCLFSFNVTLGLWQMACKCDQPRVSPLLVVPATFLCSCRNTGKGNNTLSEMSQWDSVLSVNNVKIVGVHSSVLKMFSLVHTSSKTSAFVRLHWTISRLLLENTTLESLFGGLNGEKRFPFVWLNEIQLIQWIKPNRQEPCLLELGNEKKKNTPEVITTKN